MEKILFLDVLPFMIIPPFQYIINGVKKQKISLEFNLENIIKMPHTYLVMMILQKIA
jgi:hypothetical protein